MRLSRFYLQILITNDGAGLDAGNAARAFDCGKGMLNSSFRATEPGAGLEISGAAGDGLRINIMYNVHRGEN